MPLSDFLRRPLDLLLPARCQLCGATAAGAGLCADCQRELPHNHPHCPGCAEPNSSGLLCGRCAQSPEPFFAAVAGLRLEGSVRQAIHALKYRGQLQALPWLSDALQQAVKQRGLPLPDVVVPMPTGRLRLWQRGYNPALELAKPLSRALAIPLAAHEAARIHTAKDQIGQTRKQRQQAVAGAFRLQGDGLRGKHVALVDDVMTTGASLAELARMALAAGALRVQVWAVARTP